MDISCLINNAIINFLEIKSWAQLFFQGFQWKINIIDSLRYNLIPNLQYQNLYGLDNYKNSESDLFKTIRRHGSVSELPILKEFEFNTTHHPPESKPNQTKTCSLNKTHRWVVPQATNMQFLIWSIPSFLKILLKCNWHIVFILGVQSNELIYEYIVKWWQ